MPRIPEYKELTLPQLRSFCETARLHGMSAAAASLGLSQPTVWKQIHCLEQHLGATLIEPHARGCRLTGAGESLLRMAIPLLEEFESLSERFRASIGTHTRRLVISATPRPFDEELLPCIAEFERRFPQIQLIVRQVATRQGVMESVASGEADMGLCSYRPPQLPDGIRAEPLYALELVLLVPPRHPLSRGRIRLEHFRKYPLLNARGLYADWGVADLLERAGAFQQPDRRIELEMARSIRLYVQNGLGIGIVARPAVAELIQSGPVIERSLGHLFTQRPVMHAFFRSRISPDSDLTAFVEQVRQMLQPSGATLSR